MHTVANGFLDYAVIFTAKKVCLNIISQSPAEDEDIRAMDQELRSGGTCLKGSLLIRKVVFGTLGVGMGNRVRCIYFHDFI